MTETQFIDYCRSELLKSLHNTKSSKPDDKQKYRTEGLLHAVRMLEFMSVEEVSEMIENEHQNVFGESVDKRQARKSKLAKVKDMSLDDYFDIPAIERKQ
ncbi:MAG: hypothetical protein ACJAVV_001709 [Alphaproteobacteria bacterium]|jgi:hypothetical protein